MPDLSREALLAEAKRRGMDTSEFDIDKPEVTKAEAVSRGISEGASLGLADPGRGFSGAVYETLHPEPEAMGIPVRERFETSLIKETEAERAKTQDIEKGAPKAFGIAKTIASLVP